MIVVTQGYNHTHECTCMSCMYTLPSTLPSIDLLEHAVQRPTAARVRDCCQCDVQKYSIICRFQCLLGVPLLLSVLEVSTSASGRDLQVRLRPGRNGCCWVLQRKRMSPQIAWVLSIAYCVTGLAMELSTAPSSSHRRWS